MQTAPSSPRASRKLPVDWLVLLALIVVGLAVYTAIDYGNSLGTDDWYHFYLARIDHALGGQGRPFKFLLLVTPLLNLYGASFPADRIATIGIRIVTAFVVYRLVRQVSGREQRFALACGILTLTFTPRDSWLLIPLAQSGDNYTGMLTTPLALLLLVLYLDGKDRPPVQRYLILLAASFTCFMAVGTREATIPLLVGIPVLLVIFQRRRLDRDIWIGAAAWGISMLAGIFHILLDFVDPNRTAYVSNLYNDLSLPRMARDSLYQFGQLLKPILLTPVDDSLHAVGYLLPALVIVGIVLLLAGRYLQDEEPSSRPLWQWSVFWTTSGIIAMWLGFAAFLPSTAARGLDRVHIVALPAEAVLIASIVWLATSFIPQKRLRRISQTAGILAISLMGMASARHMQHDLEYAIQARWENISSFMRTLGSLASDVDGQIVFVYRENDHLEETPFFFGWSYQYAIRYFYTDRATGIHMDDVTRNEWEVRDEGIWLEEPDRSHLYDWEHVIFITRDDLGEVVILDTIPEPFATPKRQASYDPYASIRAGYIPERIQAAFPVVRPPDFEASN